MIIKQKMSLIYSQVELESTDRGNDNAVAVSMSCINPSNTTFYVWWRISYLINLHIVPRCVKLDPYYFPATGLYLETKMNISWNL